MSRHVKESDPWIDRLSDYLDAGLSVRERAALEKHLATCADCAAVLDELRQVVARGKSLDRPAEPGRDLWPGIARRLSSRPASPAALWLPLSWRGWRPQLAAAAILLLACLALVALLQRGFEPTARHASAGSSSIPARAHEADRDYEKDVATLHREARARLTLDPHLVEVLDENLATLDAAIATYQDALAEEPGDAQLRRRLDAARHRKLEVLQQAVRLATEGSE
jgi:anti-sigma factor RsiW